MTFQQFFSQCFFSDSCWSTLKLQVFVVEVFVFGNAYWPLSSPFPNSYDTELSGGTFSLLLLLLLSFF